MYACYVDESGHCGVKLNPEQPVEVVCGTLIDLTKLTAAHREHNEFVRLLRTKEIPLDEIKASRMYRGRGAWKGVDPSDRKDAMSSVIQWAIQRGCKFIPCPIDCEKFFKAKVGNCELAKTLTYPYEAGAMNVILGVQRTHKSKRRNKGRTFVILDEQPKHDSNLVKVFDEHPDLFDDFYGFKGPGRKKTNLPRRLDQIVDQPFFAKSHVSAVVQVADVAAYIVNRHLRLTCYETTPAYEGELAVIRAWYEQIIGAMVEHTAIDPPGKGSSASFYRSVRPDGWSARDPLEGA